MSGGDADGNPAMSKLRDFHRRERLRLSPKRVSLIFLACCNPLGNSLLRSSVILSDSEESGLRVESIFRWGTDFSFATQMLRLRLSMTPGDWFARKSAHTPAKQVRYFGGGLGRVLVIKSSLLQNS